MHLYYSTQFFTWNTFNQYLIFFVSESTVQVEKSESGERKLLFYFKIWLIKKSYNQSIETFAPCNVLCMIGNLFDIGHFRIATFFCITLQIKMFINRLNWISNFGWVYLIRKKKKNQNLKKIPQKFEFLELIFLKKR